MINQYMGVAPSTFQDCIVVDFIRKSVGTFVEQKPALWAPYFYMFSFEEFLHTSPFWGFHGNTTSYLSSQSALFEPCASYASMEVVVGNCEQKLGIFRGFRKERWMLSILLFRLPFHTPDNPKIWGKCLASYGVLIFVVFGLLKIFATFGQKPKKPRENHKKQKNEKTKKTKKTKDLREMSGLI